MGSTARELRHQLGVDPAYLSRRLRSLEEDGLIDSVLGGRDARVRHVSLSEAREAEWQVLDAQRRRLLSAMTEVERFLHAGALKVEVASAARRWHAIVSMPIFKSCSSVLRTASILCWRFQ